MEKAAISRFTAEYPFLIMTEDGQYEWGNKKEDSVILPLEEAHKIQKMLAFDTLLTKI